MAKIKSVYVCQNCGVQSAKWVGKCNSCNEWNTYVEEQVGTPEKELTNWRENNSKTTTSKPIRLNEIESNSEKRIVTYDKELNRVLGGGIVHGSLVLIGGEPGIGKSTLMLQLALSSKRLKVLYVSGEESQQQIKMRAQRIGQSSENCFILSETSTQHIFTQIREIQPDILVIDSIQTLHTPRIESAAGSVSQVRECTAELLKFAKESNTPVFLVGHITKEGSLAGPKVLEHMVDTVLQFEGDRHLAYRILRTVKNRFGSTSELGIYEMQSTGLREVSNPSEILISQREADSPGVAIGASIEGNRPLLIEIQSLVSTSSYGTPQRSSTGFDAKRLNMLLAVLEKRGGFRLSSQDVFLNVAGGIKIEEPAIDLAVCASLVSGLHDVPISDKTAFAAEVGLGGEVRAVNRIDNRISEAEKLGFTEIFISKYNMKGLDQKKYKIKIRPFSRLTDVFEELLG
ncbi:DNA repair protein RadA [uncultured Roseivirga sp.]|uniref:DNA repair protein RadA n=1 Tax=uncultured Roseivirga sp. TaxID=543088 RepID=UPI0030D93B9A|tara:strand:+ start:85 stop:1458 length:1374 start_codon:yes stop_codon:yes gene_type:complete